MDAFTSRVYLLRHGEIATPGILCGHVDVALSDVGYEQMRLASAKLSRFDAIYSTPLKRCSTHAEFLARQHTINVQYNNALKEFNFGDWDGQDTNNFGNKMVNLMSVIFGNIRGRLKCQMVN